MNAVPPALSRILETVLYCREDTHVEMIRFYDEVLGLRENRVSGGNYRLSNGMLLLFNADESAIQSSPPPHGTTGRSHTCFVAPDGAYEAWKSWIRQADVLIIEEVEWTSPFSGRSFYFHDPAGNVLEIADSDIWPNHFDQG
ncbi:MAG TPA: VOC family protein [Gemmatimonadota bacterium]|nr:VOC family protein [Gemmatimonadota bacterium]